MFKTARSRILAALAILAIALCYLPFYWGNNLLRAAIAKADRYDLSFQFSDYAPPRIPDSQNATILLQNIEQIMRTKEMANNQNAREAFDFMSVRQNKPLSLAKKDVEWLRNSIAAYQEFDGLLAQAAQREKARFDTDYEMDMLYAMPVPNYLYRQNIIKYLHIRALLEYYDGEPDKAYQTVRDMIRLSCVSSQDSPFLIGYLIAIAQMDEAAQALQQIMPLSPPNDDQINMLLDEFHSFELDNALQKCVKSEAAVSKQSCDQFLAGKFDLDSFAIDNNQRMSNVQSWFLRHPGRFIIRANQALSLEATYRLLDRINLPAFELNKLEPVKESIPAWASFARAGVPNYENVLYRKEGVRAEMKMAAIAFALYQIKAKTGSLPPRLEALSDSFDRDGMIDPFSGDPFVYKKQSDNVILYSIGRDFVDNGGASIENTRDGEKGDRIWRLN